MRTLYQCDICNKVFAEADDAKACEPIGTEGPIVNVGDFAIAGESRFGWFDGDPNWIYKRVPSETPAGLRFTLLYVVVAVRPHRDSAHKNEYVLATRAMTSHSGYNIGWTSKSGHFTPVKVDRPDLAGEAQEMIQLYSSSRDDCPLL